MIYVCNYIMMAAFALHAIGINYPYGDLFYTEWNLY